MISLGGWVEPWWLDCISSRLSSWAVEVNCYLSKSELESRWKGVACAWSNVERSVVSDMIEIRWRQRAMYDLGSAHYNSVGSVLVNWNSGQFMHNSEWRGNVLNICMPVFFSSWVLYYYHGYHLCLYCHLVFFLFGMGKCGQVLEICINIEICDLHQRRH